ncbi:uncharacterized protein LOC127798186 [Diospyros lotus]|uniref:uncharacterized protein LOC127798186 n=1 Tax=Diospyros lotus TaxID=55363 RepID=UPI0022595E9B|nr:uncharacterized protein LOC127798186 [Diospyros lotus]
MKQKVDPIRLCAPQPEQPDTNSFELHESDVVWSYSDDDDLSSRSPPTYSNSPTAFRRGHRQFSGLSAALSDDHRPLVRRRPALDPSLSAVSAARAIPLVLRPDGFAGTPQSKFPQSAPMNVPAWPKKVGGFGASSLGGLDEAEEEELEEEEEMVPPHEIVARSHAATTFSVFEGVGRTLKGSDLRRVRNAVFQKTGFID